MKQINILKKAAGAISILLLLLSLAACGNMLEERKGNTVVEPVENTGAGILVRGEIKVQGAVPSRAATSCFDGAFSWKIFAQNQDLIDSVGEPDADLTNIFAESFTTTNEFTLTLPIAGNWSISASGYAGTFTKETLPSSSEVFSGSDTYTITKEGSNRAIIIHPVVWGDSLFPAQGANPLKGSINLPITSNAENVYQVSAKLVKNNSTSTATEEVVTIPPKTFTAGSSSLEASDVPAGFYTAKINFEDSIGNILYSCHEGISVYPGLTTDTWYGTAPYLHNGAFTLTSSLVEKYGAELVPSTNYVLYNYEGSGTNYQYYVKASLDESAGDTADYSTPISSFTFDTDGNFYYLTHTGNNYNINKNAEQLGQFEPSNSETPSIVVDLATNIMYSWCLNESQLLINKYPDLISNGNITEQTDYTINSPTITIEGGETINPYPSMCTINNGIAYVIIRDSSSNDTGYYLCRAPLQGTGYSLTQADCVNLGLKEIGTKDAYVKDLIYQDGNVYILFWEESTDLNPNSRYLASRGGVLKYNILTKTLDSKIAGWTSTNQNRENKWFHAGWFSNGKIQDLLYTAEDSVGKVLVKANDPSIPEDFSILSPETPLGQLSTKAFYGPKSFVAIKPKKLVILDEGIAFYTDAEGIYKYKNVNRIVTVDLEDFAITETSDVPESITFNTDETGLKPNICSYDDWQPVLYNEEHDVIFDAAVSTETVSLHSFEHMWNEVTAETVNLDPSRSNWFTATSIAIPLEDD